MQIVHIVIKFDFCIIKTVAFIQKFVYNGESNGGFVMTKNRKNYSERKVSEYNWFRKYFFWLVTKGFYMLRFKLVYRLEVQGKENVPKNNQYIVCPNHLSTLDPPLIGAVMPRPVSFMAKEELFNNVFMRWWLNWLGAFAVNREKLAVSTIKTAKSISKTNWVLGLFPQGSRKPAGTINFADISKGFATLAKATRCGILPVGIIGTEEFKFKPFSGKIIVKIGELIPYNENLDIMVEEWIKAMEKLTGFKYVGA